jgi:hypothetical protein
VAGAAIGASTTCAVALVLAAGADAGRDGIGTIEPRTRVNGMLVVQGSSRQAQGSLFGSICDPVVLKPGRRTRNCAPVSRVARLFVGYGLFAPPGQIERDWKDVKWKLWLDGQSVDLAAFGTSDRVLSKYAPADFKGCRASRVEHRPRGPDGGPSYDPLPRDRQRRCDGHDLDLHRPTQLAINRRA